MMLPKLNDHLRSFIDLLPPEFSVFRTDWGNFVFLVRDGNVAVVSVEHLGEITVSGEIVPSRQYGSGAIVLRSSVPEPQDFIDACFGATSDIVRGLYIPPLPNGGIKSFVGHRTVDDLFMIRGEVIHSRRMRCGFSDELDGAFMVHLRWDGLRLEILQGTTVVGNLPLDVLKGNDAPTPVDLDHVLVDHLHEVESRAGEESA